MSKKIGFLFVILLISFQSVLAQAKTITGVVTDEKGNPMPGVSVLIEGTTKGVATDFDGNYSIEAKKGDTLVFSYVGFTTKKINVGSTTNINVSLREDAEQLGEVVVTALGISREKKALGYATTELSSDEVSRVKTNDIANSLSGKVSGVIITQPNGGVGSGSRITIRGNNSITSNNQPLIVVDGVPMDNSGANSGARADGQTIGGGALADINPNDIESMSVLKGPNAAALYGSRASNGVLLITTKKGTFNRGLGVSVSSDAYFETPMLLPNYQNEYGQGTQGNVPATIVDLKQAEGSWGAKLDGSQKLYYTGENKAYTAQPNNVKDFFRTGMRLVNSLSVDGGGEKYSLRFSYTNVKNESILPGSDLSSNTFNIRGFSKITDKFSLDTKITYLYRDIKNRPEVGKEGVVASLYVMPRNVSINDLKNYQDISNGDFSSISYNSLGINPYWMTLHDYGKNNKKRITGFAKLTYEFTDWLSVFARIGTDVDTQYGEGVSQYGHHYKKEGSMGVSNSQVSETNTDFLAIINKDISENIGFSANIGANFMHSTYQSMNIWGERFKIPTRATIANLRVVNVPGYTPLREKKVHSLYASASFDYKKMVYLDITGRNDWSSTLPKQNRSYFYPSVSSSIILSQAMKLPNWVNLLKVRASWAEVGSDTEPYQLDNYYSVAGNGYLGTVQVSRESVKLNPNLKPERVNSLETGLEFKLFGNRLFFDFSWYDIKTKDLIFDVPVAESTGYKHFRENVGEMQNRGIEFLLGGIPVKTEDFQWEIALNYGKNKNTLNKLIDGVDSFPMNTITGGSISIQATSGGGYGDIYGDTWKRSPEGKIVVDKTGKPLTSSKKEYLGNSQPDWTMGLTNTLAYKNFNLRFLLDARIGGKIYGFTTSELDRLGVTDKTLQYRDTGIVVDGVVEQDTGGYLPNTNSITAQQYWEAVSSIDSEYVFDQTNVRLREISLTYNLPKKYFDRSFINSISFGVMGRNLLFLYKKMDHFDPESALGTGNNAMGIMAYGLPSTRSMGVNMNIKF